MLIRFAVTAKLICIFVFAYAKCCFSQNMAQFVFLSRFYVLRSLNLADNDLRCFPMALCKMKLLTELNLASNKIEDIPPDIMDLEK